MLDNCTGHRVIGGYGLNVGQRKLFEGLHFRPSAKQVQAAATKRIEALKTQRDRDEADLNQAVDAYAKQNGVELPHSTLDDRFRVVSRFAEERHQKELAAAGNPCGLHMPFGDDFQAVADAALKRNLSKGSPQIETLEALVSASAFLAEPITLTFEEAQIIGL